MSKFTIDFFELSFLAEACIPPRPIARMTFWYSLINYHFDAMTKAERSRLYDWITRSPQFDLQNDDCVWFEKRFNPDNQYLVETNYNDEFTFYDAFLHDGKYYIEKDKFIQEEFIKSVQKQ